MAGPYMAMANLTCETVGADLAYPYRAASQRCLLAQQMLENRMRILEPNNGAAIGPSLQHVQLWSSGQYLSRLPTA